MPQAASAYPTREEAAALLRWAQSKNPGPWVLHSQNVARVAEMIAARCNMDADSAFSCGLLHDIGRYEGVTGLRHVYAGYELLQKKGFYAAARICLTHSFPIPHIEAYSGGDMDCAESEMAVIKGVLEKSNAFDDLDRLIQLCDALGSHIGLVTVDMRLMDVARRHGIKPLTLKKWDAFFALKAYFDQKCGENLYGLFIDEIAQSILI